MGRKRRRKKPENVIAEVKDNELQEHGVIYGVSGSHRNLLECEFSAKSIKKFHPDLNISLFIDNENKKKIQDTSLFHKVITLTNPNRRNKLDAILNSPYEKTLYLDNDTELKKPILKEAFRLLDRFDVALTHAPLKRVCTQIEHIPNSFPEFNGGVIFFKKSPEVQALMQRWNDDYHARNIQTRYGHRDQPYLRRALWESDLRIATLLPDYNNRRRSNLKTCIRHRHGLYK
jgi:hypothetical protein